MTENLQYKKAAGSWTAFPAMVEITLTDDTATDKIGPFPSGATLKLAGERTVELGIKVVETDKTALELMDDLRGVDLEIYFDTGKINGNWLEFYAKVANPIPSMKTKIPDKPINFDFVLSIAEQTSNVSVTPSSELPTAAHSHSTATLVTGKNGFYCWVETAVA